MRRFGRPRQHFTRLILLALAAVSGPPAASAAAQDGAVLEDPRAIRFRVVIDAPRPYERMLEQGLDLVRWQRDERVTMALLERLVGEARKAAAEALAADGYFSANVNARIDTSSAEAVVFLTVEPGPRTRVRDVNLGFSGPVLSEQEGAKRIEVIRESWGLKPGEPFQQSAWDASKERALAQLARGRYAAASITESEARIEPKQQSAHLTLKLDSGPVFHAGPIVVSGLRRYPPSVIRNMSPLRRGEPYDATQLDLFQRRLLETGYFNAVHFSIDPDPAQAAAAPLNVSVIEAPSQRIETGVMFSTDTRLGVTADYRNADIFNSASRFHSQLKLNQREQELVLSVDTPPRPGVVWNTYTTRFQRSDIEGEISREAMVEYAHNWGLESTPSRVALSAHYERQTIAAAGSETNYAVFGGYRRTFRTTEEIVSPRRGLLGTFEVGASVPGLSSQEFIRARTRVNWLIPIGLRNDLLVRGEAGIVLADSRAGIPSSFLFRTGGDQTLRGYAYESIGVPQGNAIVGGRYMAVGSVEYTRWVTDSLGGAVFIDVGDAFDEPGAFEAAVGVGMGVRWRSPIGPFRADLAYGERTGKVRLHFSVGFTF